MSLDLIDDHGPREVAEGEHWLFEPGEVSGILKIKVVLRLGWHDRTSKRGLSDLPGTPEQHHGRSSKPPSEHSLSVMPDDHASIAPGISARCMLICRVYIAPSE